MRRGKPLARGTSRLATRTPLKRGKPLRQVSVKRAREIRERRAMLQAKYPGVVLCEVPYCNEVATDPHEPKTRARGGSITDPAAVRAICRGHHREIHDEEPDWAYDLGFLVHSWTPMDLVMVHAEDGGIAVWQSAGERLAQPAERDA